MWLKRQLGDSLHADVDLEETLKRHQHRFGCEMAVSLIPAGTGISGGYKYGIYVVFSSTTKLLEAVRRCERLSPVLHANMKMMLSHAWRTEFWSIAVSVRSWSRRSLRLRLYSADGARRYSSHMIRRCETGHFAFRRCETGHFAFRTPDTTAPDTLRECLAPDGMTGILTDSGFLESCMTESLIL